MRGVMAAIYVTLNAESLIFCNYILNCILIKKLKIGGQFEKRINGGHYRAFVALNVFLF